MNRLSDEAIRARVAPQAARDGEQPDAELPAHREDRAGLDDDFEHLRLFAGVAQQRSGDDQVAGRRNRQEFGQAFDQAQQQRDD